MEDVDKSKNIYLAGIYKEIADLMGVETAYQMHKYFKGQQITFPIKLYSSKCIANVICEEASAGKTVRDLSQEFGYTERRIRQIIHKS